MLAHQKTIKPIKSILRLFVQPISFQKTKKKNNFEPKQTKFFQLKFDGKENIPIHINKEAQNFGKTLVYTFLKSCSPICGYYIIYLGFGFWTPFVHRFCLFTFLLYPIVKSNNLIKVLDITAKELHVDKNGKDLIVILDKGLMSGVKAYNKQNIEKFEPHFYYTRRATLFLRFKYDDIQEISLNEKKNEVTMLIKVENRNFDVRLDLSNHKEDIPLEYIHALCRREKFVA